MLNCKSTAEDHHADTTVRRFIVRSLALDGGGQEPRLTRKLVDVDPYVNHDGCMAAFDAAGIYVRFIAHNHEEEEPATDTG